MNIFFIERDPVKAAQSACNPHVVQMIRESGQMLSTAHHVLGSSAFIRANIYAKAYENHPSTVWVRQSSHNYSWLYQHFLGLLDEYHYRYNRRHAAETVRNLPDYLSSLPEEIPVDVPFFDPPQCMPTIYKDKDTVRAYRNYYRGGKSHLLKYKRRPQPLWL